MLGKRSKIVLDTNVVISAAISLDGHPAKIFELLIREEVENFTTSEIANEIKAVFYRPRIRKILSLVEIDFMITAFVNSSTFIKTLVEIKVVKEDLDDNKFLECAVTANANYIISGDQHLLNIKEFQGIKIVSPAQFIKLYQN